MKGGGCLLLLEKLLFEGIHTNYVSLPLAYTFQIRIPWKSVLQQTVEYFPNMNVRTTNSYAYIMIMPSFDALTKYIHFLDTVVIL